MPGEATLKSWGNVRQHAPLGISCNQDKNRQIHKLTKAEAPIRRSDPRQLDTAMTPTASGLHLRRACGWPLDRAESHRHCSRIPPPERPFYAPPSSWPQPSKKAARDTNPVGAARRLCPTGSIEHGEEAGRLIAAPLGGQSCFSSSAGPPSFLARMAIPSAIRSTP